MTDRLWSWLPEIIGAGINLVALCLLLARSNVRPERQALRVLRWLLAGWIAAGLAMTPLVATRWWPRSAALEWLRGSAPLAATGYLAVRVAGRLRQRAAGWDPGRRAFLQYVAGGAALAPVAVAGFGIVVERLRLRSVEVELPVPGLPAELEGLRIVQLTDIHLGPFLSERELARAVAMANEFRPHLIAVTGDLITGRRGPLEACLRELSRLRAEAGVVGCHGNHEIYAGIEEKATVLGRRAGIAFLRGQNVVLRLGGARLNVAGVDYQRRGAPYLRGAGRLVEKDAVNLLLSHNPDVFPVAARLGFQAVISGHTHGGQVSAEIFGHSLNVARLWTPFVYGLYRTQTCSLFVSRGIGTVGAPIRLGAPPEVVCLRLRRAPAGQDRAV
jgi:predicted MPP superfamily phosphohydrolase